MKKTITITLLGLFFLVSVNSDELPFLKGRIDIHKLLEEFHPSVGEETLWSEYGKNLFNHRLKEKGGLKPDEILEIGENFTSLTNYIPESYTVNISLLGVKKVYQGELKGKNSLWNESFLHNMIRTIGRIGSLFQYTPVRFGEERGVSRYELSAKKRRPLFIRGSDISSFHVSTRLDSLPASSSSLIAPDLAEEDLLGFDLDVDSFRNSGYFKKKLGQKRLLFLNSWPLLELKKVSVRLSLEQLKIKIWSGHLELVDNGVQLLLGAAPGFLKSLPSHRKLKFLKNTELQIFLSLLAQKLENWVEEVSIDLPEEEGDGLVITLPLPDIKQCLEKCPPPFRYGFEILKAGFFIPNLNRLARQKGEEICLWNLMDISKILQSPEKLKLAPEKGLESLFPSNPIKESPLCPLGGPYGLDPKSSGNPLCQKHGSLEKIFRFKK